MLDQMIQSIDNWVSGPGGKQIEKIFIKLAEIATQAWLTALGGMAKGSGEALLHGNILGGVGLLAGAGLFGGGLLLRGAWGAGKGILTAGKAVGAWSTARVASRIAAMEVTNPLAAEIAKATYGTAPSVKVAGSGKTAAEAVAKSEMTSGVVANAMGRLLLVRER